MSRHRDSFVNVLKVLHIPVTRENYIMTAWAGKPPEEWGPELESELPRELQENQDIDEDEL